MSRDDGMTRDDRPLSSLETRASAGIRSSRDDRKRGIPFIYSYLLLDNPGRSSQNIPRGISTHRDLSSLLASKPRRYWVLGGDSACHLSTSLSPVRGVPGGGLRR